MRMLASVWKYESVIVLSNRYFVAGQDATEAFFSLHRQEVLQKPQYKRLQVGTVKGESSKVKPLAPGELSQVPYAEPTWLAQGFRSPYYNDVCGVFT
jgi:hypothetical protein